MVHDKPAYRFFGWLPAALAPLIERAQWICWDYVWDEERQKWNKPPLSAHTGRKAKGGAQNPENWGTYEQAVATQQRRKLAGVGYVITRDDNITGVDIDHCISDSGSYNETAAEVLGYAETYAEISPSGEGIRLFMLGKYAGGVIKKDAIGVEVYTDARYLTVTGNQVDGSPSEIRSAPRTLAYLAQVAQVCDEAKSPPAARISPRVGDFFANVNKVALEYLDRWVPMLHPTATKHATGAWRIPSKRLGRDLEEDLSYHPDGIRDHGEEHGLTAIDAVLKFGTAANATDAAQWLCRQMGVEPAALGWSGARQDSAGRGQSGAGPAAGGDAPAAGEAEAPPCDWSTRVIDSASFIGVPAPPRRWAVPDWIPQSDVTLLGADGGTGKTTLVMQLGCARAWGQPWLGLKAEPGNTLHLFAEEDAEEVHFRFVEVSAPYAGPQLHKFYLVPLASEECILAVPGPNDTMVPAERRLEWLETFIVEHQITLAILDAQADIFGGNEMSRSQVRSFIRLLRAIAIRCGCAIVLTAHPSVDGIKTGRGYSGSTHWNNAVRSRLYFTTPTSSDGAEPDQDLRCLELAKANRARRGQQIMLRWQDGWFKPQHGEFSGLMSLLEAKAKFMELLADYDRQGRRVGPFKGRGYAPFEFSKEPGMEKFSKPILEKAMDVLRREGKIIVKETGPQSKRVSFLAIGSAV